MTINQRNCLGYLSCTFFYRARPCVSAVFAVSRCPFVCLSVCLSLCLSLRQSVTFVCCSQTAEDIVELLSRPGNAMILNFVPKRTFAQLKGEPLQRGIKYQGGEKNVIFN